MELQPIYDWIFHQRPDGAGLSMRIVGIVLGLGLLLGHVWAMISSEQAKAAAKAFPRNRIAGVALLTVCLLWCWFLVSCMDMGEFYTWRRWLMMLLPVSAVLVVMYVPEFLAVRALGTLMLLAASPVLHAAFLRPEVSRLLLPILAYVWAIAGMFLVGLPYLLRDWVDWLTKSDGRWKLAALGGAAYGLLMLATALVAY